MMTICLGGCGGFIDFAAYQKLHNPGLPRVSWSAPIETSNLVFSSKGERNEHLIPESPKTPTKVTQSLKQCQLARQYVCTL